MGLKAVATAAEAFLGTVTSVSVTTANGVSGSVLNPTTTPAITLTLGAITPTTIAGSDATDSTSSITGAFKTAGGLGVAKAIFAGTTIQGTTITATTAFRADGTVGAPAYSFASDTNTGIYWQGSDGYLAFSVNGGAAGAFRPDSVPSFALYTGYGLGFSTAAGTPRAYITNPAAAILAITGDGTGTTSEQTGIKVGNLSTTTSAMWHSNITSYTAGNAFMTLDAIGNNAFKGLNSIDIVLNSQIKTEWLATAGAGPAITAGTAATDVNAESVTQTWNNAGVVFTGLKYTFTSTASDAASKIFDYIVGSTSFWAMNKSGIGTMAAYGSGAATFSAQGVISSVSDEAVKTDIRPFKRGLDEVLVLAEKNAAITYKYNKVAKRDYGLDMDHDYTGFSANIVEGIIPEAVGRNADGRRSFSDRPVTAALVNAMAELAGRVNQLEAR